MNETPHNWNLSYFSIMTKEPIQSSSRFLRNIAYYRGDCFTKCGSLYEKYLCSPSPVQHQDSDTGLLQVYSINLRRTMINLLAKRNYRPSILKLLVSRLFCQVMVMGLLTYRMTL